MKQSTPSPATQQVLSQVLRNAGWEHFGFTPLRRPVSLGIYKQWLEDQRHGEMAYLERHFDKKSDPTQLMPKARSAIVLAVPYWPLPKPTGVLKHLKVAKYAQNEDYHDWIPQKLEPLLGQLKSIWPEEEFISFTDSAPILERELAYFSGLGWFGKNSCLIHKKRGSYFLIAEIFSSISIDGLETQLHPDFCGTCNRCVEACPTQAILPNKTIDARRCISYLTIEAKKNPPLELRRPMGDLFFGCDICQDVCPWNAKILPTPSRDHEASSEVGMMEDLRFILEADDEVLRKELCNTPLMRAKGFGLRRNALVVVANRKFVSLKDAVGHWVDDPQLGELARWTLASL